MKKKVALITGVTGQDGSYLAELLLGKNYIVHGTKRRTSLITTKRIDHLYKDYEFRDSFFIHYLDLTDSANIIRLIMDIKPDEIYNLAAQSHVAVSFLQPEYTANTNALGTLRILEAIRICNLTKKTKFYNASSSEIYGNINKIPKNENTKFYPESPYAISKLFSHYITINYRNAYNIFAANGILFNHESFRRGEFFVTRKISIGLVKIKLGLSKCLYLGNLDAKRDWGHAKDFVYMQWKILQQKKPDDFVIATGKNLSVRDFIIKVSKYLNIKIKFKGKGLNEKGYDDKKNVIVRVRSVYFRAKDVDHLVGDSKKAKKVLNWKPKYKIEDIIKEMVDYDYNVLKNKKY